MEENKKPVLEVVKNEEASEKEHKKPTPEEVEQYKEEFDNAMKEFAEQRFSISEPGSFAANDMTLFLSEYMEKFFIWTKTAWMGVIKMQEELDNAKKMDNEKTGLTLDYQALEFCTYMLSNPGNIGYKSALEFEKIADKYAEVLIKLDELVKEAREKLKHVQYLQDKWAAASQGFYLADLEPKDEETDNENDEK